MPVHISEVLPVVLARAVAHHQSTCPVRVCAERGWADDVPCSCRQVATGRIPEDK